MVETHKYLFKFHFSLPWEIKITNEKQLNEERFIADYVLGDMANHVGKVCLLWYKTVCPNLSALNIQENWTPVLYLFLL